MLDNPYWWKTWRRKGRYATGLRHSVSSHLLPRYMPYTMLPTIGHPGILHPCIHQGYIDNGVHPWTYATTCHPPGWGAIDGLPFTSLTLTCPPPIDKASYCTNGCHISMSDHLPGLLGTSSPVYISTSRTNLPYPIREGICHIHTMSLDSARQCSCLGGEGMNISLYLP